MISALVERGAEAVILGCTEITMLVGEEDAAVPLFDTTAIHARRAVEVALEGDAAFEGAFRREDRAVAGRSQGCDTAGLHEG